jgi:hypothetical protein
MIQRLGFCLLGSCVLIVGLAVAQDPARDDPDDPPIRLKKKPSEAPKPPMNDDKKDPAKPPMNDDKKDPAKPPMNDDKKDPAKKMDDKGEPEPPAPKEDEAEVLNRVAKNARTVEEKIGNRELGDGTRQLQEDILNDLDSLIRAAESPPPQGGGGGGGDNNDNQNQNQPNNSKSQSGGGGGSMGKQSGKQGGSSSQSPSSSRQARQQRRSGSQQAKKSGSGSDAPSGESDPNRQQAGNTGGNNSGGGAKGTEGPNKNADIYKDIWGHLPESLRAEMNAYSNDKQFMSKYDELIKRYYRSLAEEGRKKGE